ncbi:MAG: lipid-A-disaccharide synthase [Thermodesulfobacteriota bacterium]|nr:lipid-A-disaccharide synthase [Thermodesulfobacteriota bacterium]
MNDSVFESKKVMVIAGEASGDMHGASLIRNLKATSPDIEVYGIGGEEMKSAGAKIFAHSKAMSTMGVFEVLHNLRAMYGILRHVKRKLRNEKPDLLILIDFPEFNLRVASYAKKQKIPVMYYISPQVWAWRKRRIKQIGKRIDQIAVIFPFEEPLYKERGIPVKFVGHPLLDVIKTDFTREGTLKKFGFDKKKRIISLLPGSRKSEVNRLLPEMLESADILQEKIGNLQFVIPVASTIEEEDIRGVLGEKSEEIPLVRDSIYEILSISDFAIVASGTATLEIALLGVPMVVVYKMSPLTYILGKLLVHVIDISLVNIVAGKRIVPEFIQSKAKSNYIAQAALDIISNREKYEKVVYDLKEIRGKLGSPGASSRVAKLAYEMLYSTPIQN